MGPVEFKSRGLVIELRRFPIYRRMTARAICCVVHGELRPMDIGMAGLTFRFDTGKTHGGSIGRFR